MEKAEKAKVIIGQDIFWFGSVDGKEFLSLNQEPFEEHASFIKRGIESRHANSWIRVMRDFLAQNGALFAPLNGNLKT